MVIYIRPTFMILSRIQFTTMFFDTSPLLCTSLLTARLAFGHGYHRHIGFSFSSSLTVLRLVELLLIARYYDHCCCLSCQSISARHSDQRTKPCTCCLSRLLLLFLDDGLFLTLLLQRSFVTVFIGCVHSLVGDLDGDLPVFHLIALQLLNGLLLSFLVLYLNKGKALAPPRSSLSLAIDVMVAGFGDDLAGFRSDREGGEGCRQCSLVNREGQVGDEEKSLPDEGLERQNDQ